MTERASTCDEAVIAEAVGRMKRFFGGDTNITKIAVLKYYRDNPTASMTEVFNALSQGKGKGKRHPEIYSDDADVVMVVVAPRSPRRGDLPVGKRFLSEKSKYGR